MWREEEAERMKKREEFNRREWVDHWDNKQIVFQDPQLSKMFEEFKSKDEPRGYIDLLLKKNAETVKRVPALYWAKKNEAQTAIQWRNRRKACLERESLSLSFQNS